MSRDASVTKSCTLHGLVGGSFDANLADGIVLDRPGQRTHWGRMVFPLPPTPVKAGDRVEVHLELAMDESLRSHFHWSRRIVTRNEEVALRHDTRRRFGAAEEGGA